MAYLYRHIRLDKNEPFYIGIGCSKNYKRAYQTNSRNKIWKYIINKTNYEIEILFDNISWQIACNKESEFIKLYGRIDQKNGILSNMTNGGEGMLSHIQSKETKEKRSISMTGKVFSDIHKKRISNKRLGKKHSIETKIKMSKTRLGKKNKKITDETKLKMSIAKKGKYIGGNNPRAKKVIDNNTGIIYSNSKEVASIFSINYNTLNTWLINNRKDKTQFEYENKESI